jgi:hypothetical protein
MRAAMLAILVSIVTSVGCGGGDGDAIDAPPGQIDAMPQTTADAAGALSCAAYCARMDSACVGANEQYGSTADCLATCAAWQTGSQGEMTNNTLGCRTYHAGAAIANANTHCRHAGPGGDGQCGTNCQGFCRLVTHACTGGNQQYNNETECTTMCSGFAALPPYEASQQSGDTFACRLYHATAASTSPGTHCAHVAVVSSTCN